MTIYEVGKWTILEIYFKGVWEYYYRETNNQFDYYRYSFGSEDIFNNFNLECLADIGYFTEVQ